MTLQLDYIQELTTRSARQPTELHAPDRLLLGPGPSSVDPLVMSAMSQPVVGHMDPYFLGQLGELAGLLRGVFRTENPLTLTISGTGTAGMETCLVNLLEPGDRVVVGASGYFGERVVEIATRVGGAVTAVRAPWGTIVPPEAIEQALKSGGVKLVAMVQGETSTGVLQPLEEIGRLCRDYGALLMVDTVASLTAVPMEVDAWGVDACYTGSQKCLSAPPGLAPVTFSARAREAIARRATPVTSWYQDVTLLERYWFGDPPVYHHTPPINLYYALREAARLCMAEGLEERWARHRRNCAALIAGCEAMGMGMVVEPAHRLASLTTVRVPEGVDEAAVRRVLLNEFNIEIAGGLGDLKGKAWRVGLMGYSSQARNVTFLLGALGAALARQGHRLDVGAGLAAAQASLTSER